MGLRLFSSNSTDYTPAAETAPNPNKFRYTIQWKMTYGAFTAMCVRYPDCSNYRGLKTMVVENYREGQVELDPHFLTDKRYRVVARFIPDEQGKQEALAHAVASHAKASTRLQT